MKETLFKLCILLLLVTISCSEEDKVTETTETPLEAELPAHFMYDQNGYHGQSRLVVDYNQHFNHRNFTFYMVDPKNYNWQKDPMEADFQLMLDVYSPGSDKFRSGTFNYVDIDLDESGEAVEGLFFFNSAGIQIDSNNDGILTSVDPWSYAVDGTIVIEKEEASHKYTIALDLIMENGKTLKGESAENWEYFN